MGTGPSVERLSAVPAAGAGGGQGCQRESEGHSRVHGVGDVPPGTPSPGQTQGCTSGAHRRGSVRRCVWEKRRDFPAPRKATFEASAFETLL